MPLAVVKLRRGPTLLERLDHSPVGVADHAPRLAGERGEKALQLSGWALAKASVCHSRGLAARYPTAQKTSKATRPPGIPTPLGSSARIRKGRWSSSSEPSAGQAAGRCSAKSAGANSST